MKRIKSNKIILKDKIFSGYLYFDDEKIIEITDNEYEVSEEYDFSDLYVCAGFIDIHTHGGGGYSFDGSVEEIVKAADFHLTHGTTTICPTVSADAFSYMADAVKRINEAKNHPLLRIDIIGAHMEGPYLSTKQSGAQCSDFITVPKETDYLPFIKANSEKIARWTYAPENDVEQRFAKTLKENGIIASAGHTDATYEDIILASDNGCNLITHLYSCTSTVTRENGFRKLGVIETAYLLDDMYVEIICDGKHLPKELIKLVYKIKGPEKIALVTDSLSLAGTEQKHGFMQNTEYIIEDGVCKLVDRSAFAGSVATADRLLRVVVKEADIDVIDAVKMLTKTPAEIMKLKNKGSIEPDNSADFVVFDNDTNVKKVFKNGKII